MSNASKEIERVRQARSILERMRERLSRPVRDTIDLSASDLDLVAELLRKIDVSVKSPIWHPAARQRIEPEVIALRATIRSVEPLLRGAARFYGGLASLMAPDEAPANYNAAGMAGASNRTGKGSVELRG